ncbi:DNA helicase PIF1, ATP-dependent [Tanacetum coccineum]
MASLNRRLNHLYAIKECSFLVEICTPKTVVVQKGVLKDRILSHTRLCALIRKALEEVFQDFHDTSKSSNDDTNFVDQEPFVVKQGPGVNSSQSPPQINHNCCYECGDSLDDIFCQRCTCKSCGKGAHYGYNCPPQIPIVSKPEPCNNQTVNEFPQTLPSVQPTSCTRDENSFTYDSKPNFVDDSPNVFNPPPQPPMYSCEFCGNDARYGHWCTPQLYKRRKKKSELRRAKRLEDVIGRLHLYDDDDTLDTIPATESDEFIKSSVENLVPIPSESEGIPDNVCDVPLCNNPTPLEAFKEHSETIIDSNNDSSSSDDDSYENIDYVDASPPDAEIVSLEVVEIVIPEPLKRLSTPSSCLTKSSSTSLYLFLEETNTFDNSLTESFCFDLEEISSGSTTTRSDYSLPDYEAFYSDDDHIEEKSSGSTTTHADFSQYDSFIFELSINPFPPADRSDFYHEEFTDELTHIMSLPNLECFKFKIEPDPGDLTSIDLGIRKNVSTTNVNVPLEDDQSSLFAYVVWIFLAFLTYPVVPPYLLSTGNEDTIFDPGISSYHSCMPDVSHRNGTFMKFNVYPNRLNERLPGFKEASTSSNKHEIDFQLTTDIRDMLDSINPLVKDFRMAGERIKSSDDKNLKLKLIGTRKRDGRDYNLPTASEVAALIVGDFDSTKNKRDIILHCQDGDLMRISELHPSYLAMQYPLFFPYAEDGYRTDIFHYGVTDYDEKNKGTRVTMKEWFAYRVQERKNEFSMMLNGRRLFQQFLVDGYTMIEAERISFNRKKQKDLRSETYSKLAKLAEDPNSGVQLRGKKVLLPSSFTGSPRYMMQNYLDAMTICKFYGYPDLFITFTCNPNWPEISRFTSERGLKSEDRPDIVTRVFKMKLDSLMKDLNDGRMFGRVKGAVYTIEFKKRGLPYYHILLWLETEDKITTTTKIDKYISAEISNKDEDPDLYQIVTEHMMHDPCGPENPSCPCTVDFKCTKKFPKQFNETTVIDDKERLPFHLQDEQSVLFDATDSIDFTLEKESVKETKFIQWMELNKTDTFARTLLYAEIPKFYVWNSQKRIWTPRQRGFSLGRIHHVPPSWGELFYLRVLLNKVKGLEEWSDLRKYDDVVYPIYRDACYACGLLQDDKMYIDGLLKASQWGMAEDVEFVERIKQNDPGLQLSDIQKKNICLTYIEHVLLCNNKSLKNILNMPYPNNEYTMDGYNTLIYDETSYKIPELKEQHRKLYSSLTSEQKGIYSTVMDAVEKNKGGMFFVYGYGGTEKTYLYKTMSAALRSEGGIVLNVASSGIATLLLEGRRTAHSRFAIPINIVKDSMCHIPADSDLADLIRQAKLIIWDEAPMIQSYCYEAFDRTLRDICRSVNSEPSDRVFGGKSYSRYLNHK